MLIALLEVNRILTVCTNVLRLTITLTALNFVSTRETFKVDFKYKMQYKFLKHYEICHPCKKSTFTISHSTFIQMPTNCLVPDRFLIVNNMINPFYL